MNPGIIFHYVCVRGGGRVAGRQKQNMYQTKEVKEYSHSFHHCGYVGSLKGDYNYAYSKF